MFNPTNCLLHTSSAAIGMPDLHKGDRFPIGCSIAADGIYPALIGSDIGCGISVYPLGAMPSHLTLEKLASRLVKAGLDGEWKPENGEYIEYIFFYRLFYSHFYRVD